jgi:hypothetical protein
MNSKPDASARPPHRDTVAVRKALCLALAGRQIQPNLKITDEPRVGNPSEEKKNTFTQLPAEFEDHETPSPLISPKRLDLWGNLAAG